MNPMIARVAAAEAAVARFSNRVQRPSSNDCGRLAGFTLRKLGYPAPLPKAGAYKTWLGAKRYLVETLGVESLDQVLDGMNLPRIPPAAALPADILAFPCPEEGWIALCVALQNGRVLGFVDDPDGGPSVCRVFQPTFAKDAEPLIAWRADPCRR